MDVVESSCTMSKVRDRKYRFIVRLCNKPVDQMADKAGSNKKARILNHTLVFMVEMTFPKH